MTDKVIADPQVVAEATGEFDDDALVRELDRRMEIKREARAREAQLEAERYAAQVYAELNSLMRFYGFPEDSLSIEQAHDLYYDLGMVLGEANDD